MVNGCCRCDEDMYEEMLSDIYEDVVFGTLVYTAGQVLRSVDPIAFRCGMSEVEEDLCDECQEEFE